MTALALTIGLIASHAWAVVITWYLTRRHAERAVKALGAQAAELLKTRMRDAHLAGAGEAQEELIGWFRREGRLGSRFTLQGADGREVSFRVTEEPTESVARAVVPEAKEAAAHGG